MSAFPPPGHRREPHHDSFGDPDQHAEQLPPPGWPGPSTGGDPWAPPGATRMPPQGWPGHGPGWTSAPQGSPPWQGAGWQPPRPVHKPGAIPLRPLGLSDMLDAAFKIIRHNAQATAGAAALVAAVTMAVPMLVLAVLSPSLGNLVSDSTWDPSDSEIIGIIALVGSYVVAAIAQMVGLVLVTGMVARTALAAALGRRLSLGEAWAATQGVRWRLIGLSVLLGVCTVLLMLGYIAAWVLIVDSQSVPVVLAWGFISVPLAMAGMFWFWIRVYYLPASVIAIERVSILSAIGRGYHLTQGHFWRTFGVALLTFIIAQVGGSLLATPFALIGQFAPLGVESPGTALLIVMLSQSIATVITTVFVTPFVGSVTSVQYLDLRIRKEAFDVDLATAAGVPGH